MPVLRDPGAIVRDAVFCESSHNDGFNYMVRSGSFKWFVEGEKEYLYDLNSDPYEQKNLVESEKHRAAAQGLRERPRRFLITEQLDYSKGYRPLADRVKRE
ncbi:MAG: hypothetical protein WD342_00205 [Verrucomicrobiales bacterium]